MIVKDKINNIREIIENKKREGKIIGLVPTMGALHEGHLSLIKKSCEICDYTVISIFVNPIQFGTNEDLDKYPRDLEKDKKLAENAGADLLFSPNVEEMLGNDLLTFVDINKMGNNLCGEKRPGHFRGVCTIVTKFFNIVKPHKAFFGKKDIQQLYIIKKMSKDLNFDIQIIPCPIVREADGLAMSSRNIYLNKEEKDNAIILYNSLKKAKKMIDNGETSGLKIINEIEKLIKKVKYTKIDYIKIVDENMKNIDEIKKGNIIALAVFIGKTRLIDNHVIGEDL